MIGWNTCEKHLVPGCYNVAGLRLEPGSLSLQLDALTRTTCLCRKLKTILFLQVMYSGRVESVHAECQLNTTSVYTSVITQIQNSMKISLCRNTNRLYHSKLFTCKTETTSPTHSVLTNETNVLNQYDTAKPYH